jgi:hypothetical protein
VLNTPAQLLDLCPDDFLGLDALRIERCAFAWCVMRTSTWRRTPEDENDVGISIQGANASKIGRKGLLN